jgi:serine/threonine-protein kinase HipA
MILYPADAKKVDSADVFKGEVRAGQLQRTEEGVAFVYDAEYLASSGPAVAWTVPPRVEPYLTAGGAVPAFFAGLLPEGARLQAVIAAVKTSPDDEMSLLLAVGSDAVGDVSVVPAGEQPRDLGEAANRVDDSSAVSFRELFSRSVDPATRELDRAIPGVQDKLSDAMISFPVLHEGPSILKLTPERYPRLVENEAFFLRMAAECGFQVPSFQVVRDRDGETGLLVERFDRRVKDGRLVRIAQEDACQLAGRWPADKYRLSMREVIEVVSDVVSSPRAAALELVLLTAFSYLIANGDMHAKNISVRWLSEEQTVEVTPAYDLVTTRPYPVDDRLALAVDGRDLRIRGSDLIRFAERFGVPEKLLRRRLSDLCDRAEPFIRRVDEIGFDDRATRQLRREMQQRISELRA